MKKHISCMAAIFGAWFLTSPVFAADELTVKWTNEVGAVVKLLKVEADQPVGNGRFVTFTYQALKSCRQLSVYGHSYSSDGIQLPVFGVGVGKMNVAAEQKFRDQAVVTYEPGHYLVLDKVFCM